MRKQYQHFIDNNIRAIKESNSKLHELYDTANNLYATISKHKSYLKLIAFPYDKLEQLNDRSLNKKFDIKTYNFDDTIEKDILKSNIYTYMNILVDKIPIIKEDINFRNFLIHMPFKNYMDMYNSLNTEISRILLLGDKYYFPGKLGGLQIATYDRNFNKKTINFGATNKLKKEGKTDQPIYYTDDTYTAPVFLKDLSFVPNYKYYKFKFTKFINTEDRSQEKYYKEMDTNDQDSIIYDTKVGNWEKMLAMKQVFGEQIYEKYGNKLSKSEAYNRKYIR